MAGILKQGENVVGVPIYLTYLSFLERIRTDLLSQRIKTSVPSTHITIIFRSPHFRKLQS